LRYSLSVKGLFAVCTTTYLFGLNKVSIVFNTGSIGLDVAVMTPAVLKIRSEGTLEADPRYVRATDASTIGLRYPVGLYLVQFWPEPDSKEWPDIR